MASNALTLTDVVGRLDNLNDTSERTQKNLENYFKAMERSRLDQLEALRESKKSKSESAPQRNATTGSKTGGLGFSVASLMPLIAGLTALGAAFAGLRGWEIGAIKGITKAIGNFTRNIISGVGKISTSILKSLGIYKIQARDPLGRYAKGMQWNVVQKLQQYMRRLSKSITGFFAPIQQFFKGEGAITKTIRFLGKYFDDTISVAKQFGASIKSFFTPLVNFFTGFGKTAGGALSKVMPFISKFGRYFTAFLKPIGVIFSFFAGFKAFQAKEGGVFDKLGAGVGAFLGDFFGGLGNLLTKGLSWLLGKAGLTDLSAYFGSLDLTTMIAGWVESIFSSVSKLFSGDLSGALGGLVNLFYGESSPINTLLLKPLSLAIDWLMKKFSWRDKDAPPLDIWQTVANWTAGIMNWLAETWNTTTTYLSQAPGRITDFFDKAWTTLTREMEQGWIKLKNWVMSIPDMIMMAGIKMLEQTKLGRLALATDYGSSFKQGVMDRLSGNAINTAEQLGSSNNETNAKLARLEERRGARDQAVATANVGREPIIIGSGGGSGSSSTVNAPTQVVTPPPRSRDDDSGRNW